jgi:hypothetical protein
VLQRARAMPRRKCSHLTARNIRESQIRTSLYSSVQAVTKAEGLIN